MSDTTFWGQVAIFVTTVATFAYNIYRENRNRAWDLEDRERAEKLSQTMERTRKVAIRTTRHLAGKIDENTKISTDAFAAANTFNVKLEDALTQADAAGRAAGVIAAATADALPKLESTGDDTNTRVRAIEERVGSIEDERRDEQAGV